MLAVRPTAVAVTVPWPPFGPAVNCTEEPVRGWNRPSPGGSAAQLAGTGKAFPYWSVPSAVRVADSPAGTVRGIACTFSDGRRAREDGDGLRPARHPGAAAVTVLLPARVSR